MRPIVSRDCSIALEEKAGNRLKWG